MIPLLVKVPERDEPIMLPAVKVELVMLELVIVACENTGFTQTLLPSIVTPLRLAPVINPPSQELHQVNRG